MRRHSTGALLGAVLARYPSITLFPFYLRVSLLKLNIRKKGILGLLGNPVGIMSRNSKMCRFLHTMSPCVQVFGITLDVIRALEFRAHFRICRKCSVTNMDSMWTEDLMVWDSSNT